MKKSYDLLIPSAILVPGQLRDVGNLPAVVYPLNQGIVLDSLLECHPDRADTVIVAGEGSKNVKRAVAMRGDAALRVVTMDEIGDLCDTVLFGLRSLSGERPVVINFSDTVALGAIGETPDSFYASSERYSHEWTYFSCNDGRLRTTYDRSEMADGEEGEGDVFVGVFRFDSPETLVRAIEETASDTCSGVSHFYRALERYAEYVQMTPLAPEDWLDIGHRTGYVGAQLQVKAREFNHISIDKHRAILRKTSEDVEKFIGEVKWYLKLPADVSYVSPRIFSYSLAYAGPWVEMEYYPYHTLHSLWLNGNLDSARWRAIFDRIGFLLDDLARYELEDDPGKVAVALREMYLDKTIERLEKLRAIPEFSPMFSEPVMVNGVRYPSISKVERILEREVPERLCSGDVDICLIHGDLCFANVMIDDSLSFVKVVDPRGKFGPWDLYGDRRYELAKLAHSVDGKYDFIIKDRFEASWSGARIDFEMEKLGGPDLYAVMRECLAAQIGGGLAEVELIESLLFLSMVPLHGESLRHQMAMLGTGLALLDRSIGIKE